MTNITFPFLTDLDGRAAVKGSRDPLGAQAVWTRFGRHVVGNLTTVTTSVRDFTTLLLGYYFVERVAAGDSTVSKLATFLKWEQLAAYSRALNNKDYAFRGVDRVRKNLNEGSRVTLSQGPSFQILSNQQVYGLWGLYSVASDTSGLVEQDSVRLTPIALEFVERCYMPMFRDAGFPSADRIVQLLGRSESKVDLAKSDLALGMVVAKILQRNISAPERKFYSTHLVDGGPKDPTKGLQPLLASIIQKRMGARSIDWNPSLVRAFEKEAHALGSDGVRLEQSLARIRTCESVLAPAARLFAFLQGFDGKPIDHVAKAIAKQWGSKVRTLDLGNVRQLRGELASIRQDIADRWIGFADSLSQGGYTQSLRLLIDQNEATMQTRGGAAWISIIGKRLKVKISDEQGSLPKKGELSDLWRFPYFLDSLSTIATALSVK